MSRASYDNPDTCRREYYAGGEMVALVDALLIVQYGKHVTPKNPVWRSGYISGRRSALPWHDLHKED